jgi:hypothetical protein
MQNNAKKVFFRRKQNIRSKGEHFFFFKWKDGFLLSFWSETYLVEAKQKLEVKRSKKKRKDRTQFLKWSSQMDPIFFFCYIVLISESFFKRIGLALISSQAVLGIGCAVFATFFYLLPIEFKRIWILFA